MKKPLTLNEQFLVKGAIQGQAQEAFAREGQRISIQKRPVDLEPVFQSYTGSALTGDLPRIKLEQRWDMKRPGSCFIRLWFSEKSDKANWRDFDLIRGLAIARNPIHYLVMGNKEAITHILVVDMEDIDPVKNALKAKFPDMECELTLNPFVKFKTALKYMCRESHDFDLRDYYTHPAYWRPLTVNENLKSSPLLPIYSTLSSLDEDEMGFYLVAFKPVIYPWSKNMLKLIDTETEISKYGNINISDAYYPEFGDRENRSKVSSPICAVSVRICAFCKKDRLDGAMNSLSLAFANFQSSGESLKFLSKSDYGDMLDAPIKLLEMIANGFVYRSGNLLNSEETAYFFHFPEGEIINNEEYRIDRVKGFKVPDRLMGEGVAIGYNEYIGKQVIVRQPERIRANHTAIEGLINQGKSCLLANMCLDDIYQGQGVGFIDLHGDTLDAIIKEIPKERIEDVIYFDPCDDEFELCYNSSSLKEGEDIGKKVDDLIVGIRSLYSGKDWGHLIESTLIPVFYTLLRGENLTLSDARVLLSKTEEGYRLRQSLLPLIDNQEVKMFWTDLFERLPIATIHRVVNKLSKFLLPKKVNRIFSQRKSLINFRKVIDEKKIFLGYIPAGILGSDCANILGSVVVSDFHNAGMSRQDIPFAERVPYNLYIDECQRISVKSFEDSLRELRKYNLRLILAYQQREQLSDSIKFALGNVGTMIVLGLDWDNAQRAFKEFYGRIEPNELMMRNPGDGFVKMDNDIINIKTFPPKKVNGNGFRDEIIRRSHELYYVKINKDEMAGTIPSQECVTKKKKVFYDEI